MTKVLPAVAKLISGVPLTSLPGGYVLHPYFEQEGVQKILDDVKAFSVWIGLKFTLDQPVLVAIVDAENHSADEQVDIAAAFDRAILQMLDYSATMGGLTLGKFKIGGVKMSSTGILLYTFFDPSAAVHFGSSTQSRCKIMHFWKKTNVVPWVIDVVANEVKGHSGLPLILPQLLNKEKLARSIAAS